MCSKNRWFVIVGAIATGCGGGANSPRFVPASNVVPVSGTLTYQGNPLAFYQVTFTPKEGGGHSASGRTDESGKFKLGTNVPGDGANVGTYIVSAAYSGPPVEDDSASKVLTTEPEKLPKPSVEIPKEYKSATTSKLTQEVPAGGLTDLKIDLK
jgi:hypothetical protein